MPKIVEDKTVYRAVLQTVFERGYAGATTKEMAAAADISEVTLFRKYGTKGQLVKQAIADLLAETSFASAAEYSGDLFADLLRFVVAYWDSREKYGQFLPVIMAEMPRYPELAESMEIVLEMVGHIGRLLAQYQEEGILVAEPPLQATAALLGPLMITAMIRNVLPAGPLPPVDLAHHVTHFLHGRQINAVR